MRKILALLILTALWGGLLAGLSGCQLRNGSDNLDPAYRGAYEKCLEKLDAFFPDKNVNKSMVTVRYLKEEEKDFVQLSQDISKDYFAEHDERFWVFTIGNTSGYDFVQIVCDSRSEEVIGYLPVP